MKNLKNYLLALIFSIIGGITSITGYEFFKEEKGITTSNYNENVKFANYVFDTTDVVVPEGLNFIYTSKKQHLL